MVSINLGMVNVGQSVADSYREKPLTKQELSDFVSGHYTHSNLLTGAIDIQPTDNCTNRTQCAWSSYFNKQKRIKRMISAPDVYRI